jgi:hypothetical protein
MGTAISVLVSGGLALAGVALGSWLGSRSQSNQWMRETQLSACQRLMDQYANLYNSLALSRRGEVPDLDWSEWNQALTAVSFVCTKPVVDAAHALDETFWRGDWAIRGGRGSQADWLEIRRPIEEARATFVLTARRQNNRNLREPVRTLGRPADDDPMWQSTPES